MPKPRSKNSHLDFALLGMFALNEMQTPAQIVSKIGISGTDVGKLRNAKEHLLLLLDDPYYYEAYQELRRNKHPKLFGQSGRPFDLIGDQARKYQEPQQEKLNLPGRPSKAMTAYYLHLYMQMELRPGSLKSNCRAFVTNWLNDPSTDAKWRNTGVESLTNFLYEKIRGARRRQKEKGAKSD